MVERTRVELPSGAEGELQVFVNGVPQQEGRDYRRDGGSLVFERPLAEEGRLSTWRWLSMLLGIAGTYRKDEKVDVIYDAGGVRRHATGLRRVPEWNQ